VLKQKRLAADSNAAAAASTKISTEWRNVKRNVKLRLTIEEAAG